LCSSLRVAVPGSVPVATHNVTPRRPQIPQKLCGRTGAPFYHESEVFATIGPWTTQFAASRPSIATERERGRSPGREAARNQTGAVSRAKQTCLPRRLAWDADSRPRTPSSVPSGSSAASSIRPVPTPTRERESGLRTSCTVRFADGDMPPSHANTSLHELLDTIALPRGLTRPLW